MSPQATQKREGNGAISGTAGPLKAFTPPAPLARPPGVSLKTSLWLWVRGRVVLKGPGAPRGTGAHPGWETPRRSDTARAGLCPPARPVRLGQARPWSPGALEALQAPG